MEHVKRIYQQAEAIERQRTAERPSIEPIAPLNERVGGLSEHGKKFLFDEFKRFVVYHRANELRIDQLTRQIEAGTAPPEVEQERDKRRKEVDEAVTQSRRALLAMMEGCLRAAKEQMADPSLEGVPNAMIDVEQVDWYAYYVADNLRFAWTLSVLGIAFETSVNGNPIIWAYSGVEAERMLESMGLTLET